MIKLEYYKKEKFLLAYNVFELNGKKHFEFLGDINISPVNDDILELDHPSARPKYGNFLYQMAAMYATSQDKYLSLTRGGDLREAAFSVFENICKKKNQITTIDIPEEYNNEYYEWTDEEENPFCFKAIKIKPTQNYTDAIEILESTANSPVPKELREEWLTFFGISYEQDSNKWIDEDYPLETQLDINDFLGVKKELKRKRKNKPR